VKTSAAVVVAPVVADAYVRPAQRTADFVTLTKPRLNFLVLITTLGGMYIAAPGGVPLPLLLHALVGTALVAGGAAALNQAWEHETDRLMRRTSLRPIPGGRLRVADGMRFGTLLSAIGLIELTWKVTPLAAMVAAATLVRARSVLEPAAAHHRLRDPRAVTQRGGKVLDDLVGIRVAGMGADFEFAVAHPRRKHAPMRGVRAEGRLSVQSRCALIVGRFAHRHSFSVGVVFICILRNANNRKL